MKSRRCTRVSHPGVVPLLDSWITRDGEPCLAMPFLDGPTLRQWLTQTGPADPNVAASIVRQLGAALSAIHARGIVHRDLKPENIILREPGTPSQQAVIIDFGTSAARGPELHLEETTTVSGSIHYLARNGWPGSILQPAISTPGRDRAGDVDRETAV